MALAADLKKLNPAVLRSAKEALKACWTMDYEQAEEYLRAKGDQLKFRDPERGREQGMRQFLDEKRFRPGLQPYEREP
jgi:feruloyl-CoA hydratase/lyase